MPWWVWLAAGFVLLVAELVTPSGFFIMFFGLGALTVGVAAGLGVATSPWIQWLLFTLGSLAYVAVFRGRLQRWFQAPPPPAVDSLVGDLAVPLAPIPPGAVGRVEVRGSTWNARNLAAAELAAGERCTVVGVDGLLLAVRPERL